ncbi:E3 ubiquitin-protein ligase TRIM56 [Holothuria leucospilota]|uniref:E3 ubiquitin-protein ligase TRIM56 n=1 Tax=Holothuria leucospilota TaxID=206669 RepID=A0A9Q1HC32_HOLLE|nr:E3 ubiquitin-protein ligase TRIM56 [Holothuria leucospilota]
MASPDHSLSWSGFKEGVLPCVFCDDTLKDPKKLPCLHRVCRACLNAKIEGQKGDVIRCPKCSFQISIPTNGIDGFETDLLAQSVGKLNEIHLNFNKKKKQERCSVGCGRRSLPVYCFKCEGYLCDKCNKSHHQKVKAFESHQSALLTLSDFSLGDGTVQRIFSHIAPKCKYHPAKTASKCCDNCNNEVVCDECATESHGRHAIQQISDTVKRSKKDLNNLLSPMKEGIADVQSKRSNIDDTKGAVDNKIKKTSGNLQTSHKNELSKITTVENLVGKRCEERILNLKNDLKVEIKSLENSRDEEIKKVTEKYEKLINEKKEKAATTEEKLKTILKREKQKFEEIRSTFNATHESLVNDLSVTGTQKRAKLLEMQDHFDQIVVRHEHLIAVLSSTLATDNDWIIINGIAGISSAAKDLVQDINKSFPSLASLAEFPPYKLEEVSPRCDESVWKEVEDPFTTKEDIITADTENGKETTEL